MRRWIVALIVIAVVAAGGWYYYDQYTAQQQAAAEEAAAIAAQTDELANVIWASGKLQPARWAALSPAMAGLVSAIHVEEGQQVGTGDLLIDLDNGVLAAQVVVAEAAVVEAEAARARIVAGATDAEISAAQAALASAQAAVSLSAGQMLEAQSAVTTTLAQVVIAQRQYAEAASHPTQGEITAANARIAVAQAAVEQAQAAYNLVRGDPAIGALPQSMALRQATAGLEAAQAEAAIVTAGPSAEALAVLSGQIDAARAQVGAARSRLPGAESAVLSALAQQASAQAALDALLAGPTAEDIAMVDARVQSGQAALASARANLAQMQVRAPFDGQVGQINVRPGEMGAPGQPLVLLGDTSTLHVETTDLRETDVLRLRTGMPVEVSFDAMADRAFSGRIVRIAPVSNTSQGSTNYTVEVDVTDLDPNLRWGMTAFVNINPDLTTAAAR
jgi:multidrug efflux pump subunit AcrA (membrane-fusion protein)